MKKFSFLFIFLTVFCSAQVQRFTYEYKFVTDSTNIADIQTEMMLLDVGEKASKYYSYDVFVSDSIMNAELQKQDGLIPKMKAGFVYKGNVRNKVTKEYPAYKIFLHTSLSTDMYKVEVDSKPVWKILPEKEKIGNYTAQKATTNYLGRQWTAWFCTDLPFQDGPYQFYGLPGLIVKVEDKNKTHIMTLVANKIVKADIIKEMGESNFNHKQEISVNSKQFNKLWREYIADPNKAYRQQIASATTDANGNSSFRFVDASGKTLDPNEQMRKNETRVKESLKKNNNRIDLEMYKY